MRTSARRVPGQYCLVGGVRDGRLKAVEGTEGARRHFRLGLNRWIFAYNLVRDGSRDGTADQCLLFQ